MEARTFNAHKGKYTDLLVESIFIAGLFTRYCMLSYILGK